MRTRIGINGFGPIGRLALGYDNEIGRVNRMIELAQKIGASL
jgi:glyceraldehyde-3-phosphate dehydrogenase/erythrose-4-phosphate dehydrogenase